MRRALNNNNSINTTTTTPDFHKSCDRCGLKKRKCGGGNPCRRCIRLGETCTYSKRRRVVRPRAPGPGSLGSTSDPSVDVPLTLQAGRGVRAALQHHGLKRCRLRPSPATGLVGMQENIFLSDYFGCVGFLPFTSQSNIRETMVNMFAGSISVNSSDYGEYSTTDQHFDTIMPVESQLPVGPSTCIFWCAVALGALVKGRPIESVEKYSRLATEALASVSGPPNAEVGRAWAILAYMSDFAGDRDSFHEYVKCANSILCIVQEQQIETLPVGLSDVVKHGETIRIFVGDVNEEDIESFCNQERAVPQIAPAATEGEICKFVMQSYRSFEQALCQNLVARRPSSCKSLGGGGEPSAAVGLAADPVADELLRRSSPHFITSLMRKQEAVTGSSGLLDMMIRRLRAHSRQFEPIEHAAGRANIREGIGGLIIHGTLVFEKVARKDISGALGNLETCGEVFERYPGLCRFTMGAHVSHMLIANLAIIDDPRARVVYEKMSGAYNSALLPGTSPMPPFEEWQGVSTVCGNYNCRLMEFMVNQDHGVVSSPPPPHECAAGIQEKGPRNEPEHGQQRRGVTSATDSPEGTEGNSAGHAQPRNKITSAPRPHIGCMENVLLNGQRTVMMQPPEPMLTTSLFLEDSSEPTVDPGAVRLVNEQSSPPGFTALGAQAVEGFLLSELSSCRTMIDEAEYDSIGVEDWLEVTQAMLDVSGRELDSL